MSRFIIFVLALSAFSVASYAQATSVATVDAAIVAPITISKTSDMNFGTIMRGTVASTIILSTAGARTVGVGDAVPSSSGLAATAAAFTINGSAGAAYTISLPAGTINLVGPGPNMTVGGWSHNLGSLTGNFAGAINMLVGATLNVGAGQTAGSYTGSFTLSVDYN